MKRIFFLCFIAVLMLGCHDDDSFSVSSGLRLSFSTDTLQMDTVFAQTPSSTYSFWVRNTNNDGLRLSSVRLARRNQTGFRVNVDGSYLDNSQGSQVSDLEIRRKDSLLVFVELTAAETASLEPQLLEDDLVFTLESGVEQKVRLRAWAWDALKWQDRVITRDSLIESSTPIIIYGGIKVNPGVTLTIRNTTLYFHDKAGITIDGRLVTDQCVMRGDRLDRMFSYLPYDRVSGQWQGLHFTEQSTANQLNNTEIRNAMDAVVCDSATLDSTVVRLSMSACVIHNAKGHGLWAVNTYVSLSDCQITNTLGDCVSLVGGIADIRYCTLAQFYPFSAERGAALRFVNYQDDNSIPLIRLSCEGSILTGYEADVLQGNAKDSTTVFNFSFANSLLRTPKVMTADSLYFTNIQWETPKDSVQGKKHFKVIDEDNLYYDFHLDSLSTAQGWGCYR